MKTRRLFGVVSGLRLAPAPCAAAVSSPRASDPLDLNWLLAEKEGKSDQGEKETVRVRRRRRTESEPEERERASAPRRRRPADEGAGGPPAGGAGGGPRPSAPSGGQLPGGMGGRSLFLILVVIVVVWALRGMLSSGPQESNDIASGLPAAASPPVASAVPDLPTPTAAAPPSPRPFTPPAETSEGQTWLVMLYQDADDKILEQDIYVDLNEAERVGSSDRVHLVAQVDRFRAGYQGDGNWATTKRFYITQDEDLQTVRSQQVADLGEANMADGDTLVDFVTWALDTFPADKHILIMSDHGMGWPGGWTDPEPGGQVDRSIPLSGALGEALYLMELDAALEEIRAQIGLEKFELIGLDACLMGHLEVFSALAPHARYAVASQETEPALGWAYTGFLEALKANPDMSGADLGQVIVKSYIQEDQRIVDEAARADLLRQSSPIAALFGGVSAEQLAQQMDQNTTLSAVDLSKLPVLEGSVNDLSLALQEADQQVVARARTYAQSFTSVFGSNVPPSYIDLGHFVQLLTRESGDRNVAGAAERVLAAIDETVIAERHGPQKPGAMGVSIYFPNSQLYRHPATGYESYTAVARRFATTSLWDDFLAYHYTGRRFEPGTNEIAAPERGTAISAPGSGQITATAITLSDSVAAPGRPVLLSTDIRGQHLGYVYLFAGFYDRESNSIFLADADYLESSDTREIDGVYYPVWPETGEFTLEFEWEPLVFAINDGVDSVVARFKPQTYGASFEEAVYTVDGIFTYADGGESRYARLYFSAGELRQVFGFTSEDGTGAPREIIPQSGDTFTVLERWLDLDQQGNVVQSATQDGGTLTFGDQMFTWEELDAAPGDYIVGFIVEDLDGNTYHVYDQVMVE